MESLRQYEMVWLRAVGFAMHAKVVWNVRPKSVVVIEFVETSIISVGVNKAIIVNPKQICAATVIK